jgi:hypothetical protein
LLSSHLTQPDGPDTNGTIAQSLSETFVYYSTNPVPEDELVLNFGPAYGLYHYDQAGGWKQWNTINPSQMVTVDLNGGGTDELVAAFPGFSLYTYDSANGRQLLNTVLPVGMKPINFYPPLMQQQRS